MTKVKDIVSYLDSKYAPALASSFDIGKIGLQFGSYEAVVTKALITLDGSSEVVKEALDNGAQMLICHHPFMFNSLLSLNYDSPMGQKMLNVMQNKLNIFAMHTNFDVSCEGMNDILANILGLTKVHAEKEEIDSESFLRVGYVNPVPLQDFAKHVKVCFNEPMVRVVGDMNKTIKKVGIVGGAGSSELFKAIRQGCDVLVTGEIRHNNAIDALDYNIAIVEVSHSVERLFKQFVKDDLQIAFPEVEFILASKDTDPFKTM